MKADLPDAPAEEFSLYLAASCRRLLVGTAMIRRGINRFCLGFLLTLSLPNWANSMSSVRSSREPIPEVFRERVEALVRKLRPDDAEEAIRSLKAFAQADASIEYIIFRIEAGCRDEICMTVMAWTSSPELTLGFVIDAGPWLYKQDTPEDLWGASWWPIIFPGTNGSYIVVHGRGRQFAFSACNECYGFPESGTEKLPYERRKVERDRKTSDSLMMPFEEFKRQIARPN